MKHLFRLASAVLVAFALSGCTAVASAANPSPLPSQVASSEEGGTDVGNGRPLVTYDGLMVRRRAVVAVNTAPDADLPSLRKEMNAAAARHDLILSDISPDVLDPVLLERTVPDMTVALPDGYTLADARDLASDFSPGRTLPGVEEYHVVSVLVHELRFAVASTDPSALAESIAREGILADALGNYETIPGSGELGIGYTGPLLSDQLVETVREGIARVTEGPPADISVTPLSLDGVGVDMAKEPEPEAVVTAASVGHGHTEGNTAVSASSSVNYWAVYGIGMTALFLATLVLLWVRRPRRQE